MTKAFAFVACLSALVGAGRVPVFGQAGGGATSPALLSGCEIDLDGNGQRDVVLFLGTGTGRRLVALLNSGNEMKAYVLDRIDDDIPRVLGCKNGSSIKETSAGSGRVRTVKTPGAYVSFAQPEGAERAYVWQGKAFVEVWTAD